jgi:hypothetical protein
MHNGVAHVALGGRGIHRGEVETEVAVRDELSEPQWILPLCTYTE